MTTMNRELIEKMMLSLFGELSDSEQAEFNQILADSNDAQLNYEILKSTIEKIQFNRPSVSQSLLDKSRSQFQKTIQSGRLPQNEVERLFDRIGDWATSFFEDRAVPRYALVLGSVLLLVMGGSIGYIGSLISIYSINTPFNRIAKAIQSDDIFAQKNIVFQNIRFVSENVETGELSLSLDAVSSLTVTGKPTDKNIRKTLAYALLYSKNAGVKIQSIAVIRQNDSIMTDKALKDALLRVLKYDDNAGVRHEALSVLKNYPLDKDVKEAVLYTLNNDENPGLRIEAINLLSEKTKAYAPELLDSELEETLKSKVTDANQYIRLKALELLKKFDFNFSN